MCRLFRTHEPSSLDSDAAQPEPEIGYTAHRPMRLWHRIVLVALIGTLPLLAITVWVISVSINKDIDFGLQEEKGNAFQRPLEVLLDLLPRHQDTARKALASVSSK